MWALESLQGIKPHLIVEGVGRGAFGGGAAANVTIATHCNKKLGDTHHILCSLLEDEMSERGIWQ